MSTARRPLLAANWKLHGSRTFLAEWVQTILARLSSSPLAEVVLLPPAVYLDQAERLLSGSPVSWGGQNLAATLTGAFTGEISGSMLAEFGCRYVLVGHSERRMLYHEDNSIVATKFKLALESGLQPILCLGENLEQYKAGLTQQVVSQQLDSILNTIGVDALQTGVLAYEPIWAIGTGFSASPAHAQTVHAYLRQQVATHHQGIAESLRILYGGSIKATNVRELLAMPDIDGGLVGGASLNSEEFGQICSI